jgi:hypothetical protein
MPTNIPISEEELNAIQGIPVILNTKEEGDEFLDLHAAITPLGLMCGFELDPEEVKAITNGKIKFLINFLVSDGVSPFTIIFERDLDGGSEEENSNQVGLQESGGPTED